MPLGAGSGFFGIILPSAKTNLITNPSFELGTAGVVQVESATLGTSSQYQQRGAWSLTVAPSNNGTSGAMVGSYTEASGTNYYYSAYVRGQNGIPYMLAATDTSNAILGSVAFTGGGTWQHVAGAYAGVANAGRRILVRKNGDASTGTFYVDGVQVEIDNATTYIDGDQDGCAWLGAPHASQSTRDAQYRGGGTIVPLSDLGFAVDQATGVGMPPIQNTGQSYALTDGGQFQRSRAAERPFTLTSYMNGTAAYPALAGLHSIRRQVIDAFKSDRVTPQQPVRFLYYGAGGTSQIDAVYDGGLEMGPLDGFTENAALRFLAYSPYWESTTQHGTSLAPRVNLGSTNFIAKRSPLGAWGTLGANGTTVGYNLTTPTVRAFQFAPGGTMFFGGEFGSVAGTVFPSVGMYYTNTNAFGTLIGGTLSVALAGVFAFARNPGGTLFVGGQFGVVGGTTTFGVARWTGAWGTLTGGTISGSQAAAIALLYSPLGTLIVGGQFGTVGGTNNADNIAFWTGAWGTLGFGGVGDLTEGVNTLAWGLDNRIYIGGAFTNVGGTVGTSVGFFKNGAFGTMGNATGNSIVNALGVGLNGLLYEAGFFSGFSGIAALNAAQFNGAQHSAMGPGLGNVNNLAHAMTVDGTTGDVYVGGAFQSIGSVPVSSNFAKWNGYAWIPPDIIISTPGTIWAMAQAQDNTLYIGGNFSGTAQAASVATVVNTGMAAAYPTMRARNSGAGTARLYQLVNTLTGDGIYFNLSLLSGEEVTLDLAPGNRSFTSNFRGNIFGAIIPGSNLATWNLLPGTNYVSYFADTGSVDTSLYWTNRHWSADAS
jgi:hypothetical protein